MATEPSSPKDGTATPPRESSSNRPTPEELYSYAQLAKDTNISEATLKKEVELRYWTDKIDMESNPSATQLASYAGCALADLRTTSLVGDQFACAFVEDFNGWEVFHFKSINRAIGRELLAVLASKGIYPNSPKKDTQYRKLYDIANGEYSIRRPTVTPPPRTDDPQPQPSIEQPYEPERGTSTPSSRQPSHEPAPRAILEPLTQETPS